MTRTVHSAPSAVEPRCTETGTVHKFNLPSHPGPFLWSRACERVVIRGPKSEEEEAEREERAAQLPACISSNGRHRIRGLFCLIVCGLTSTSWKQPRNASSSDPRQRRRFLGSGMVGLVKVGGPACGIGSLVLLLPSLLSAVTGRGDMRLKTLDSPVNGSLGHSVWLPVEIDNIAEDAEIIWKYAGAENPTGIARYDMSEDKVKIFKGTQFEGRVKIDKNFTLQINQLREEDEGIYIVTVTASVDRTGSVSLRVYEPVSEPTVNMIHISSAETCILTLLCFTERDRHAVYSWTGTGSNATEGHLGHVSANGSRLELSLGMMDDVDCSCTVSNPISSESVKFTKSQPCKDHEGGVSDTNSSDSNYIALLLVFLIPCVAFSIYKCRRHSSRSEGLANAADGRSFERASVPNNYPSQVNSEDPESPRTIYAEVQRSGRT
ncbi:SLAM family member 5-like isoform X2 [Heptranchias perlo]|uniref:SLAM family member 5-like isoform X2 n=1 Tax=Heptranchias perlo TaxID=212740 RepID=UPI00355942DB